MKTVIFNGSPRKRGATATIVSFLQENLPGEVILVNSYTASVSPCIDCRHCMTHRECAIKDEMQDIYRYINEADVLILASPIYFGQLTGSLLSLLSRLQYFWTDKNRLAPKKRLGAVVLVDGGMGIYKEALSTGKRLLQTMGAEEILSVYHSGTDNPNRANPLADEQTQNALLSFTTKIKEFLLCNPS